MFIYPYKTGSKSVIALKELIGAKVIKRENSTFKGSSDKTVINWGCTQMPDLGDTKIVNNPKAVAIASDKLKFFNKMQGHVSIPEFTTDKSVAREWSKTCKVVARTVLNGHSGKGVYILSDEETFNDFNHATVKVYVKYIPKKDEYRIHVGSGKVNDMQRKAIHPDMNATQVNHQVRTHHNGYIFVRNDVNPPQMVLDEAIKAVEICGLDFGAVDVIFNNYRDKAFVLEVNTAPGLEGTTLETYSNYFSSGMKPMKFTTGTPVYWNVADGPGGDQPMAPAVNPVDGLHYHHDIGEAGIAQVTAPINPINF
jgi:hypothetical protein